MWNRGLAVLLVGAGIAWVFWMSYIWLRKPNNKK